MPTTTSRNLRLEGLVPSPSQHKKWRAKWLVANGAPGNPTVWRPAHTDFGAVGYEDYTMHRDPHRRTLYRQRHRADNLNDPRSPGALSWYILWGDSTSLQANLKAFRARFGV